MKLKRNTNWIKGSLMIHSVEFTEKLSTLVVVVCSYILFCMQGFVKDANDG